MHTRADALLGKCTAATTFQGSLPGVCKHNALVQQLCGKPGCWMSVIGMLRDRTDITQPPPEANFPADLLMRTSPEWSSTFLLWSGKMRLHSCTRSCSHPLSQQFILVSMLSQCLMFLLQAAQPCPFGTG